MLTSIQQNGRTLNLRTHASPNIFDIDSISLLIGPNGSGKTCFLQATIEQFARRSRPSFDSDCRLGFNFLSKYDPSNLADWSLIYFNPLPHRQRFRTQRNFIDASAVKPKNIFQLAGHSYILEGFGLKVNLVARLKASTRKIAVLFANALIENPNFESAYIHENFSLDSIRSKKKKLNSTSDFDTDQEEILILQKTYNDDLKTLAKEIMDDFSQSINAQNVKYFTAIFAIVEYMIKQKKYSIQQIIGFATRHLESTILDVSNFSTRKNEVLDKLLHETLAILNIFEFKPKDGSPETYEYIFGLNTSYHELEHSPALPVFSVTLPHMSSGQQAVCSQVISIYEAIEASANKNNILIMIDEGDAFLHLQWQRKYIWQLNLFLKHCKDHFAIPNLQLIIASHSPLLTSDMPSEYVCELPPPMDAYEGIKLTERELAESDHEYPDPSQQSPSFAAPLHKILNLSFDSSTIGEFAVRRINSTIKNLKLGFMTPRDKYIISIIDDPIIQRELLTMAPSEVNS